MAVEPGTVINKRTHRPEGRTLETVDHKASPDHYPSHGHNLRVTPPVRVVPDTLPRGTSPRPTPDTRRGPLGFSSFLPNPQDCVPRTRRPSGVTEEETGTATLPTVQSEGRRRLTSTGDKNGDCPFPPLWTRSVVSVCIGGRLHRPSAGSGINAAHGFSVPLSW